jgi:hypothetical protein
MQAATDPDREHPVPESWRPTLRAIVDALVEGDYELSRGVPNVAPVRTDTAKHMRDYVADYGESLIALPAEAWTTSVSSRTRTGWNVLVDLWTQESGRSDMVLDLRAFEVDDVVQFEVYIIYVP